jgi:hypothetical protein
MSPPALSYPVLSRSVHLVYAINDGMFAFPSLRSFTMSFDREAKLNLRFISGDRSLVLGPCMPLA